MPSQAEIRRARRLIAEAQKRAETKNAVDFDRLLFGPQRDFVTDPRQLVVACCSRRAGKTWGICVKLVKTALEMPGVTVFYVTNTRRQAERGFWTQALKPFLIGLGFTVGNTDSNDVKVNQNELTATFKNGSRILLGGANDSGEIENYRGTKTPLVILDEAQNFRSFIKTLVDDIFIPQLLDYGDKGQILMTGTPNAACHGYFHDAFHGKEGAEGWVQHGWTMFDNPHLPNPEKFLANYLKRKGWNRQDPKVRREFFGEWVRDTSGLVYPIRDVNIVEDLPDDLRKVWSFVLGLDLGYVDATAFVVMAYNPAIGRSLVVESYQKTKLIPDAVAVEVEHLLEIYDFEAIVADTGGLGKAYSETMIQKYGLPVEAAEKRNKAAAIEHLNGDLRANSLQIYRYANDDLLHDCSLLSWNYDKIDERAHGGHALREKLQIDDRTPDHLTDAMLYAHRKCRGYLYLGDPEGPTEGSPAWWVEQEEAIWAEVARSDEPRDPWDLRDETLVDEALF